MPRKTITKCAGLWTSGNELSAVPEGALVRADNVIIRQKDIIEPRPGFDPLPAAKIPRSMFIYQNRLYAITSTFALNRYDASAGAEVWSADFTNSQSATTFYPPQYSGNAPFAYYRSRTAEAKSNIYLCTDIGVEYLDSPTASATKAAGLPKGLDAKDPTTGSILNTGTGAWLPADRKVAYRVVWGYKDANANIKLGAPSGRYLVTNPSGGTISYVRITVPIPTGITSSHFVRVYRSWASETAATDPDDELYLAYENTPTGAEIVAKEMTIADYCPESMLNDPAYSNAKSGDGGIIFAHDRPPHCEDIAWWQNRMWYANTTQKQRLFFDLLGTSDGVSGSSIPSGLVNNDTVTIDGVVYTAKTTPAAATDFQLTTTAATPALNVEATARALIAKINTYYLTGAGSANTNPIYAYYVSFDDGIPGQMMLERALPSKPVISGGVWSTSVSFTVTVSRATAWNLTSTTSDATRAKNGLMYSEDGQPEAVPLVNYFAVGSQEYETLRIVPLRDRLFVFKQDGIFVVSGEYPFRVDLVDPTIRVLASDTVDTLANKIYALTNQGVVTVTDAGVTVISRPIEDDILTSRLSNIKQLPHIWWGCGYENERLFLIGAHRLTGNESTAGEIFCYNAGTNTWTKWLLDSTCAVERNAASAIFGSADGGLYGSRIPEQHNFFLGRSDNVWRERGHEYNWSFADNQTALTATAWDSTTNTLTLSSVSGISPGDVIFAPSGSLVPPIPFTVQWAGRVTSVGASTVKLSLFVVGSITPTLPLTVYAGHQFTCDVVWASFDMDLPDEMKQFSAVSFHFDRRVFDAQPSAVFDYYGAHETVSTMPAFTVRPVNAAKKGLTPVSTTGAEWSHSGGERTIPETKQMLVPQALQRWPYLSVGFRISEAWAWWALNGITIEYDLSSARNSR